MNLEKIKPRGFIVLEQVYSVKKLKLISRVTQNKHFGIFKCGSKHNQRGEFEATIFFSGLTTKYRLGESWILSIDDELYCISFKLMGWTLYKQMLFTYGMDKAFKEQCLKDKHGSILIGPDTKVEFIEKIHQKQEKSCNRTDNLSLKDSISQMLFNVKAKDL
jgi:hypothetical protein